MGENKLGRGGETSATSVVSLTWESRGREKGFLHSSSQLHLESPVQLFPLSGHREEKSTYQYVLHPAAGF